MPFAYVKDKFVPEDDASISIKDRGFRFGDGIFETIRVYNGVPYQLESHLNRLKKGLTALKIDLNEDLEPLSREIIKKNKVKDGILRISVSRGTGSKGYLPINGKITIVIETTKLGDIPSGTVDLWLSNWQKPSLHALPVNNKLMQGLNSTLARMEAEENKCFEAVQFNNDKYIAECSSANIFWFKNDILYTPELECGLVAGTTREAVIRISPYKIKQGKFAIDELSYAEEVFICNAAWQLLSARKLNPLGFIWKNTEKTRTLQKILQKDIEEYVATRNT